MSYLLISFWYTRILANKAALKAMIINKIGDLFLLIAISVIILFFGSVKYSVVFGLIDYFPRLNFVFFNGNFFYLDFICFCLLIGAMGKSAQIGLHV